MTDAWILGVLAAVLGVKACTVFLFGRLGREIHGLQADDQEVTGKIKALDATHTQLNRNHKYTLSELDRMENQRDQLVTNVKNYGAVPVDEPSLDESVASQADEQEEVEASKLAESAESAEEGDGAVDTVDSESAAETSESQAETEEAVRILIVDDNDELRDLLSEAFSRSYVVDRAADGLEALDFILKQGKKYDAILTDLNMPNLNGMTFLEHLPEETNVIVMSAYLDRPEFSAVAAHPRVFRTIEKPFKLGMIKDAVACLVEE